MVSGAIPAGKKKNNPALAERRGRAQSTQHTVHSTQHKLCYTESQHPSLVLTICKTHLPAMMPSTSCQTNVQNNQCMESTPRTQPGAPYGHLWANAWEGREKNGLRGDDLLKEWSMVTLN